MKIALKIAQLKSGLSRYLRSVQRRNEIIVKDRETPIARIVPYKRKPEGLISIQPSRSLKDLDKLPVYAPKVLTVEEVDRALREERRERLDDFLPC